MAPYLSSISEWIFTSAKLGNENFDKTESEPFKHNTHTKLLKSEKKREKRYCVPHYNYTAFKVGHERIHVETITATTWACRLKFVSQKVNTGFRELNLQNIIQNQESKKELNATVTNTEEKLQLIKTISRIRHLVEIENRDNWVLMTQSDKHLIISIMHGWRIFL